MTWQRCTLGDFLGDFVVYRNLEPVDARLPGLLDSWAQVGLDHYYVPRKTTPEYAAALMRVLQRAQKARGVSAPLARLLFIGDTAMNDGTAARNLTKYLPLRGFIGADRLTEPAQTRIDGKLMLANRWEALSAFLDWAQDEGLDCDERTALLIDLDKTALGARGRNDKVIDSARVQAVQRTMQEALADHFDEAAFRAVYDPLNQPRYHQLTADNQDYLAYICLMVVGGVYGAEELWRDLATGDLATIEAFVDRCEGCCHQMPPGLLMAHQQVRQGIEIQDPTPFKDFRRGEYHETVSRMDLLPDGASEARVLASEIVITAEVASVANAMAGRGVLLFGISDKPDEASLPTTEDAAKGYKPIHRTTMKVFGQTVA